MPLVEISMWKENASSEIKENLIKEVSDTVSSVIGAPLEAVEVIIHEVPKANWGKGGVPSTKWN